MIIYLKSGEANPRAASFVVLLAEMSCTGPSHIAGSLGSSHASRTGVRCRARAEMRARLTMSPPRAPRHLPTTNGGIILQRHR